MTETILACWVGGGGGLVWSLRWQCPRAGGTFQRPWMLDRCQAVLGGGRRPGTSGRPTRVSAGYLSLLWTMELSQSTWKIGPLPGPGSACRFSIRTQTDSGKPTQTWTRGIPLQKTVGFWGLGFEVSSCCLLSPFEPWWRQPVFN